VYTADNCVARIVRTKRFSAAYQSVESEFTLDQNQELYGRHSSSPGLGCNFLLEAHIEGRIDPVTGMIINLVDLDAVLSEVVGALDHHMLHELPIVNSGVAVTLERLADYCFESLSKELLLKTLLARLVKVRIYEGDHLWIERGV
jgi:6-pyruvoyltetrahydropterin/6-carboxytetrahydropterin synthase